MQGNTRGLFDAVLIVAFGGPQGRADIRPFLERVLRGRSSANSNPSLETLVRLASALGVEVSELLSEPSRPRPKDDRISMILRTANPATRRRVLRVAEALVREEHAEDRQPARKRR